MHASRGGRTFLQSHNRMPVIMRGQMDMESLVLHVEHEIGTLRGRSFGRVLNVHGSQQVPVLLLGCYFCDIGIAIHQLETPFNTNHMN